MSVAGTAMFASKLNSTFSTFLKHVLVLVLIGSLKNVGMHIVVFMLCPGINVLSCHDDKEIKRYDFCKYSVRKAKLSYEYRKKGVY